MPTMINGEKERISIETVRIGKFKGQSILVIYDDEGEGAMPPVRALHLLDEMTIAWLLEELAKL